MSIIHQALKKVQDKLVQHHQENPVTLQSSDESVDQNKKTQQQKTIRLIALIVLPLITVISLIYFYQQMSPVVKQAAHIDLPKLPALPLTNNNQTASPTPPTFTSVSETPSANKEASKDPTEIQLQGIMSQDGSIIALINNNIYQKGDKINGMTIVEINPQFVIIDDAGVQTTYKLGQ